MTATVKGLRNIGVADVVWTEYTNPGKFGAQDSSCGGRVPEEGCTALVVAEWTDDSFHHLVHAYIIGYLPRASLNFELEGYSQYRNHQNEENLSGDHVVSGSSKNYFRLSASGTVTEECTAANYRKRSPEHNRSYDVCDNSHKFVGNHFVEHVTSDAYADNTCQYVRAVSCQPMSEFNALTDREKAFKSIKSGYIEEIGNHLTNDFCITANAPAMGVPVYKACVLKDGVAVYTKIIDAEGNVYEATSGNCDQSVAKNKTTTVALNMTTVVGMIWAQTAQWLNWLFGACTGGRYGNGTGNMEFSANLVKWRTTRIDHNP
jgi:hypothetical protein